MLTGVIADDFTGDSDVANTLAKGAGAEGGLKTTQYPGAPMGPASGEMEGRMSKQDLLAFYDANTGNAPWIHVALRGQKTRYLTAAQLAELKSTFANM